MLFKKCLLNPFKTYLVFGLLSLFGIFCYFNMPVALYPNSAKPKVIVHIPYGTLTQESFLHTYGRKLEKDFKDILYKQAHIQQIKALYGQESVSYELLFSWGDDGPICLKEVRQQLMPYQARWPEYVNRAIHAFLDIKSTGFFLATFSSVALSAEEIYDTLEKQLIPKIESISGASKVSLYNPNQSRILIEIDPYKLAEFRLLPDALIQHIQKHFMRHEAGSFKEFSETKTLEFSTFKQWQSVSDLLIPMPNNQNLPLSKLAKVSLDKTDADSEVLSINGARAIILHISPKPNENLKALCDEIQHEINQLYKIESLPNTIDFKVLINPGESIQNSVNHVAQEVLLCAFIAVIVLFLFIGSFSATFTAIAEIPTSILLSFILLKFTGIQINLISLGGLALSVGMNVDASIVIIDAIIKRLQTLSVPLGLKEQVQLIIESVYSVATPLVLATMTSLIVFIPLALTSDLTYAILGDLAIAVIYSHGLSLLIALILVPTVRLQIMRFSKITQQKHSLPLIEKGFNRFYAYYLKSVCYFIEHKKLQWSSYSLIIILALLSFWFLPQRITREIIAKPDTHLIGVHLMSPHISSFRAIEQQAADFEKLARKNLSEEIDFIFRNVYAQNKTFIGIQLKKKKYFKSAFSRLQSLTQGYQDRYFHIFPFNPSELPIPDPPDWRVLIQGKTLSETKSALKEVYFDLLQANIVKEVQSEPDIVSHRKRHFLIEPKQNVLLALQDQSISITPQDIANYLYFSSYSKEIGQLIVEDQEKSVFLSFPLRYRNDYKRILSFPIALNEHIVPLRVLVNIEPRGEQNHIYRINGENRFELTGQFKESEKSKEYLLSQKLSQFFKNFKFSHEASAIWVDPKVELTKAIQEVFWAILIALVLIFLVLYLRFSNIWQVLIIMLAIPFGGLGVLWSLALFDSTISLNSALGVVLLIGISVSNSILLVEKALLVAKKNVLALFAIKQAIIERIRPILMTSLTTLFGMLPIAMGYGEGGKVLQPLGIAVCGGLWVSLLFTLYVVPASLFKFLSYKASPKAIV